MAESSKPPKEEKKDNPEQSQRFVETAKALDADESGAAFERALETIKPVEKK